MERIIRQITENLVSLLPEDNEHYALDKLHDFGFPRFIVQRIQVELERNLAESMRLPQTDWANIDSERVQHVWQQFIGAIRAEARLPASYAKTVIETAVADVLEMLVQPRKNLPEIIFGTQKELSAEKVQHRINAIVVYRHFAALIPRYMQKKNLKALTRERCEIVIATADEKITARYSPLNWAQMLEPLFNLLNEQIDTNLLRLFFEDKNMPRIARQFDLMNSSVNRATLIEVLSSPDSLNFEGYKQDQSELFDGASDAGASTTSGKKEKLPEPQNGSTEAVPQEDREVEPDIEEKKSPKKIKEDLEEDSIIGNFHSSREKDLDSNQLEVPKKTEEKPQESKEAELNTTFKAGQEQEQEKTDEDDALGSGLNQIFSGENGAESTSEKEPEEPDEADHEPGTEPEDEEMAGSSDSEEREDTEVKITQEDPETPMWQRYMSSEDIEAMEAEEAEEQLASLKNVEVKEEENTDDDGFIDEPIIDLTEDDEPSGDEVEKLQHFLDDDRSFFVEGIFRDSERAYEEAIEEISAIEDWKTASKFIDKNVFKRNLVDMYSEAAVDFTDRLQSYFIEKSKS